MKQIRGLTLIRPWPWAILHAGKRIENREWAPRELAIGDYIAIHAGKGWDEDASDFIMDRIGIQISYGLDLSYAEPVQLGEIVPDEASHPSGVIVAVCRFAGIVRSSDDPWFMGPIGWKLDQVTPIEPVPCRGYQALWPLPDDVLARVRAGYLEARAARVEA